MFKKLKSALSGDPSSSLPALPKDLPRPYAQEEINLLYNMLFCDELSLFQPKPGEEPVPWKTTLFQNPQAGAVRNLAQDTQAESRVRALAYLWLRTQRQPVPAKELLGVIVEVPLGNGLDTLAAYADGRVRYINQTGHMSIFEGSPPGVKTLAQEVVGIGQGIVHQIGPWDKKRLPPPALGNIRLSFLVSDGLYFGEGGFEVMAREPMAAPLIQKATELLQTVVAQASN